MNLRNRILVCALGLLLAGNVRALSSDQRQPLQIEADQAEIDQQNGISTYRGNVRLTRGSMQLMAQVLVIKHVGGNVQLVTATGSPAKFSQRSDQQQEINARAQRMEYHVDTGQLLLIKGAELHQDANVFASDRIVYDSIANRVNAGANAASPEDRVHIIIQPGNLPGGAEAPQ